SDRRHVAYHAHRVHLLDCPRRPSRTRQSRPGGRTPRAIRNRSRERPRRRMIDFLLLGNGATLPLPDRWLSSLLIRCEGELTLFDCGEGTQIPWRRFGWGFRRVGAICISHWHGDHVAGLPGVLLSLANAGRTEPVAVYGPEQTARVIAGLRVVAPVLPFDLVIHELGDGERFDLPGGLRASAIAG